MKSVDISITVTCKVTSLVKSGRKKLLQIWSHLLKMPIIKNFIFCVVIQNIGRTESYHSLFSTLAKFSEKLTFSYPLIGITNVNFSKNFTNLLNEWSQIKQNTEQNSLSRTWLFYRWSSMEKFVHHKRK